MSSARPPGPAAAEGRRREATTLECPPTLGPTIASPTRGSPGRQSLRRPSFQVHQLLCEPLRTVDERLEIFVNALVRAHLADLECLDGPRSEPLETRHHFVRSARVVKQRQREERMDLRVIGEETLDGLVRLPARQPPTPDALPAGRLYRCAAEAWPPPPRHIVGQIVRQGDRTRIVD